ncbi:MAG: DUF2933 domain-containing protein [Chloroflexota bacterium]|nr:DUF2933 domain-containing protein [Chloroflexota bacterium]
MHEHPQHTNWFQSRRTPLVLLGFLVAGAFFLITEHMAHVLGFLPFAIFLVCLVMMLFMHGGHGGHDEHNENASQNQLQSPA